VTSISDIELETVERVEFFKRDELTADLICCELMAAGQIYFVHEEWYGWSGLIAKLEGLDGFRHDWFSRVSQPPFAECRFAAFVRAAP